MALIEFVRESSEGSVVEEDHSLLIAGMRAQRLRADRLADEDEDEIQFASISRILQLQKHVVPDNLRLPTTVPKDNGSTSSLTVHLANMISRFFPFVRTLGHLQSRLSLKGKLSSNGD
ncbi:MAG: hypothetical protein ACR2P3_09210 [Geminicoccaceae bacterium]